MMIFNVYTHCTQGHHGMVYINKVTSSDGSRVCDVTDVSSGHSKIDSIALSVAFMVTVIIMMIVTARRLGMYILMLIVTVVILLGIVVRLIVAVVILLAIVVMLVMTVVKLLVTVGMLLVVVVMLLMTIMMLVVSTVMFVIVVVMLVVTVMICELTVGCWLRLSDSGGDRSNVDCDWC